MLNQVVLNDPGVYLMSLATNSVDGRPGRFSVSEPCEDRLACKNGTNLTNPPSTRGMALNWGVFALLLLGSGLAFWIDVPVADFFRTHPQTPFRHTIRLELFGHGLGALMICLTIACLDPAWRQRLPRIAATVVIAGVAANAVKLLIARNRPHSLDLAHIDVWQTFCGWLPSLQTASSCRSFPSGHAAVAVALALGLAVTYPRGRWLFWSLGCGAGLQRVVYGDHFPSDVLAGAAIGWVTSCLVDHVRSMPSIRAATSAT